MTFVFIFWCPYYFIKEGFAPLSASYIALTLPVGTAIGSITIIPLLSLCPNYIYIGTIILMFL